MAKKIDPIEIKKEMIKVYDLFLRDPENRINRKKIHELWDILDGSEHYVPYDAATSEAVGYLVFLLQGGRHEYFTKERVLKRAKKILENLRKS
ncbi:hypothetical protein B6U91_01950 [Candidatus Pacearchaeota archaeon ex4484_71]|nr:MAG: hypothetical protein B6U91_01950 [Candidatus Pacearchaeota archaeon ex4484_71]